MIVRLKRFISFLLAVITLTVSMLTACCFDVNAEQIYEKFEYISLIRQYYNYVNEGEQAKILTLYSEELNKELGDFFSDEFNKTSGAGIFGVSDVDVIWYKEIDSVSMTSKAVGYENVKVFLTKTSMCVETSDKYYRQGVNYFKFFIGNNSNGELEIFDVTIPLNREIYEYDELETDATEYINYRNKILYGIEASNNSNARGIIEPSVIVDVVKNPTEIKVKMDTYYQTASTKGRTIGVDFRSYCKTVSYGEITLLKETEALKANALAIKMFAYYYTLCNGTGVNYDVTDKQQTYNPAAGANVACANATDAMFDTFMLDSKGGVFPAFYRKDCNSTDGEYCRDYGGIMSQLESDELASADYDWEYILRLYYTRKAGISYYNEGMNYGSLIFTSAHAHSYNYDEVCIVCGAKEVIE